MGEVIDTATPEAIADRLGSTPLLTSVIRFIDMDVTVMDVTVIPIGYVTIIHTI